MVQNYYDRDLSWLSFNARVLEEGSRNEVPVMERIRFLSIYSSNLDEFYRVRIPLLMALEKIKKEKKREEASLVLQKVTDTVAFQLNRFGDILRNQIIPALKAVNIIWLYETPFPESLLPPLNHYFHTRLLASLQTTWLEHSPDFFPESNAIYLLFRKKQDPNNLLLVKVPDESSSRFFLAKEGHQRFIVFADDIIRHFLPGVFNDMIEPEAYSFKITRDADLDLQDEFEGDLAEKIEKQLVGRDMGFATRLLYDPAMPQTLLEKLKLKFQLARASVVSGGRYHNLRDLSQITLQDASLNYPDWPPAVLPLKTSTGLLEHIRYQDILLHPPYHDYATVLRFFNEAAVSPEVEEIWITLYRIAADSRIAGALITAAANGKLVTVFVELKARFDEANNIRWAKRMKAAGIRIVYSIPGLKVHAKVALLKLRTGNRTRYAGILATGNFNERTAKFYTDHVLMTTRPALLQELELLFLFLCKRRKPKRPDEIHFRELAVAQFNLRDQFVKLISAEINHVKQGRKAAIRIKLNNLEEQGMIDQLYAASNAGVEIQLLVRGICRLIPGVKGMSENIQVKRIVDRFLEHGRIFYFLNDGKPVILAGSADWMERNIYRRIEVCFPIYDPHHKNEISELFDCQWVDNVQAEWVNSGQANIPVQNGNANIRSQELIWKKFQTDD